MPLFMPSSVNGKEPQIHDSVFIAHTGIIIGDVYIDEGSNIWYGVVIIGDVGINCFICISSATI